MEQLAASQKGGRFEIIDAARVIRATALVENERGGSARFGRFSGSQAGLKLGASRENVAGDQSEHRE